jgi:UPF0755 protein
MNSNEIVNALRQNVPVDLAFNNQERVEDFAGRIGMQIEADSLSLLESFKDKTFLEENGFTEDNVLCMFIPNSYEFSGIPRQPSFANAWQRNIVSSGMTTGWPKPN